MQQKLCILILFVCTLCFQQASFSQEIGPIQIFSDKGMNAFALEVYRITTDNLYSSNFITREKTYLLKGQLYQPRTQSEDQVKEDAPSIITKFIRKKLRGKLRPSPPECLQVVERGRSLPTVESHIGNTFWFEYPSQKTYKQQIVPTWTKKAVEKNLNSLANQAHELIQAGSVRFFSLHPVLKCPYDMYKGFAVLDKSNGEILFVVTGYDL